ncbi:class I SAM-dependent methyltransferase [Gordonia phosphorivorans]|uniref:Class I SAM-dependent methyltransferase n=2 Tax=Gordonia phosphorivorans TaxID=1056982 RepID=A0ABV6H7S0_9ACTN
MTSEFHASTREAVEAYSDRVTQAVLGFAETASIVLGDGLGWYAELAAAGEAGRTASDLALATDTQSRYAQEWLEQQTMAGLVEVVASAPSGAGARRFRLPAGAAEVLVHRGTTTALLPMVRMLRAGVAGMPELLEAYKHGGGVTWDQVGDEARQAQAEGNRPWFLEQLPQALASVESLHSVLSRPGARITDVACGFGWSTLALARAYPQSQVTGIDIDEPSIVAERGNADARGPSANVEFYVADGADPVTAHSQDAVFIFEALHDMPFPVQVLSAARTMVKPDGAVVVMDEAVAATFDPEAGSPDEKLLERLMYAYSLFLCLPDSMATPGSAATGTVMRPAVLERYAIQAGFAAVEQLPIGDFSVFRFYRLTLPDREGDTTPRLAAARRP